MGTRKRQPQAQAQSGTQPTHTTAQATSERTRPEKKHTQTTAAGGTPPGGTRNPAAADRKAEAPNAAEPTPTDDEWLMANG
ncbi:MULTISPECIES: hypothetical protein [Cyanophyceae]|uniref:hypothetical protein n=1 Tax=Cyanophyceae TaxID=3028117 RepID=UPI001689F57C|nr:hypothetical protein [Trichocoleus sp. FACHB-40]MBD2006463.1 hypothetical protein [Trichocoleus sp. FACHB-40]